MSLAYQSQETSFGSTSRVPLKDSAPDIAGGPGATATRASMTNGSNGSSTSHSKGVAAPSEKYPAGPQFHQHAPSSSISTNAGSGSGRNNSSALRESTSSIPPGYNAPLSYFPDGVTAASSSPSPFSPAPASSDMTVALINSVVQRLVKRLPLNSGARLQTLEEDPLIRACVSNLVTLSQNQLPAVFKALIGAMDTLNKSGLATSVEEQSAMLLLQSQLLILRIMASCLFFHWRCVHETSAPPAQPEGSPHSDLPLAWVDPPPLEDGLAKQLLSSVTVSIRQVATREDRQVNVWAGVAPSNTAPNKPPKAEVGGRRADPSESFSGGKIHWWDDSFVKEDGSELETIPPAALSLVNGAGVFVLPAGNIPRLVPFEVPGPLTPHLGGHERPQKFRPLEVLGAPEGIARGEAVSDSLPSLSKAIYRHASLVVCYLSSSNWSVVQARIRNRLAFLSSTSEETPTATDLRIIECANLDRSRLESVLHEVTTAMPHIKKSAQLGLALILRRAIWTFTLLQPAEFAAIHNVGKRLESNPESLFDYVFALADTSRKKQAFWPMLVSLLIVCPDMAVKMASGENRKNPAVAKKVAFLDQLKKGLKTSKLGDVSAMCATDILDAAAQTTPSDRGMRLLAAEMDADLRERTFDNAKTALGMAKTVEPNIISEALISFLRFDPKRSVQTLVPFCMAESTPIAYRTCLVKAIIYIFREDIELPWVPSIASTYPLVSAWMRRTFKEIVYRLAKPDGAHPRGGGLDKWSLKSNIKALRGDDHIAKVQLALSILSLWCLDLKSASHGLRLNQPVSMATLSSSESVTDDDGLLEGAMKTDSVLSWVYFLCRAGRIPGHPDLNMAAQECLAHCAAPATCANVDDNHRLFLRHFHYAFISCLPSLRTRWGELVILAEDLASQRHWHKLLAASIKTEVTLLQVRAAMTAEEQAETPLLDIVNSQTERLVYLTAFFHAVCSVDNEIVLTVLRASSSIVVLREAAEKKGKAPTALAYHATDFFRGLCDPTLLYAGRVARQKKIRALVVPITAPAPVLIMTFREMFRRWQDLTSVVLKPLANDASNIDDTVAAQWHNYAGFLCALGGCCVEGREGGGVPLPPNELLIPSLIVRERPRELADRFITEMIDLLVHESVWVREKVKELLANDLHAHLIGTLFGHVHQIIGEFFDKGTGLPKPAATYTVFVEQSITIVHQALARIPQTNEWTENVDVGSLMVLYVEYVNSLGKQEQDLRIRMSMCQLCSSLMKSKSHFAFTNEMRVRNRLFQALTTWTSDSPATAAEEGKTIGKIDRLQRELDAACLQAISALLDGLPLLLPEDALMLDDKEALAKSRQFALYSSYFIKILNRTRVETAPNSERPRMAAHAASMFPPNKNREIAAKESAPLRESAVQALSHLLAANIDSGLHHSLVLGYSEDSELRAAFMRIMTNVLEQGAAFDDLERLKDSHKQSRLVEMVGDTDLALALSMCEGSRTWDSDNGIDKIMLSIFDSRGGIIKFLKAAVEEEIEKTTTEEMVFRSNSNRTHLLSLFARTHGYEYLRSILTPLITEMANLPTGQSFEIDPQRLNPGESAVVNQARLEETAQAFISNICDSAAQLPAVMRELCRHIRLVMDRKFPNSRYQGVGGFIFLRFISPAIVAPQNIDMQLDGQANKDLRRGLLLVSKILQTLASNNRFSVHKESFMFGLNDFLLRNVWKVTTFLDGISDARTDPERLLAADQPLGYGIHPYGYGIDGTEQRALHKWLADNADKIGAELLSRTSEGPGTKTPDGRKFRTANGKQTYEELCAILAEMGPPPVDPFVPPGLGSNPMPQVSLADFQRKYDGRESTAHALFKESFYEGPPSKAGRPVFYDNPYMQEAETTDYYSLAAHKIRTVAQCKAPEFDVIVDLTAVKPSNLMPAQWMMFTGGLVPPDMAARCRNLILFNGNTTTKGWFDMFRTLPVSAYPHPARVAFSQVNIVNANSLPELDAFIERRNLALSQRTLSIVTAVPEHRFTQVTMVWYYRALIPVTFKIGGDHLHVTALKGQDTFTGKLANTNDIFHLAEIDDVRSVSVRGDDNTFFFTCRGGEVAFVFNSRERASIVQALREARARVSRVRHTNKAMDRQLLPTDVPGTLLNMALLNLNSDTAALRLSSYNLLCALSTSFNFGNSTTYKRLLSSKHIALPSNTTLLVNELSEEFAEVAPGVTLEVFTSWFEGFEAAKPTQKIMCLQYLLPWLANLVMFTHTSREQQGEYSRKIREILSGLISVTAQEPELYASMIRNVWCQIGGLDDLIPYLLDVFTEAAIDSGLYTPRFDLVVATIASFSSMNLRGKLLARLRRLIAKTAYHPSLGGWHENVAFKEIATLCRINMVLSFTAGRLEAMLFLPEIIHVSLLLAGNGVDAARFSLRGTLINFLHSLCTEDLRPVSSITAPASVLAISRDPSADQPADREGLIKLMEELSSDEYAPLFGLPLSSDHESLDLSSSLTVRSSPDNAAIAKLATKVYGIIDMAAPSLDAANTWRARMSSLVTSKAFQYNPFVQSRAFLLLGCLAVAEIDDDLVYQILVSLRGAIVEWANLGNAAPMISIVTCLSRIVKILPAQSRYLAQMFWLGTAMIQHGQIQLFSAGVDLIQATVTTLHSRGMPQANDQAMLSLLMEARFELRESACRLDDEAGVDFEVNFGFALATLLVKGLRLSATRERTTTLLRTMLEVTSTSTGGSSPSGSLDKVNSEQLGFFVALLPTATKIEGFSELLALAGLGPDVCQAAHEVRLRGLSREEGGLCGFLDIVDNKSALLAVALMSTLLQYAENDQERLLLYELLADAGQENPAILSILYDFLSPGMKEIIGSTQSGAMLDAVQDIIQIAVFEPVFSAQASETVRRGGPEAFLEESGFAKLLECGQFQQQVLSDAKRLGLAKLSAALLAGLIEAEGA